MKRFFRRLFGVDDPLTVTLTPIDPEVLVKQLQGELVTLDWHGFTKTERRHLDDFGLSVTEPLTIKLKHYTGFTQGTLPVHAESMTTFSVRFRLRGGDDKANRRYICAGCPICEVDWVERQVRASATEAAVQAVDRMIANIDSRWDLRPKRLKAARKTRRR